VYSPRELAEYAAFRSALIALRALPLPRAQRIAAAAARRLFDLGGKRVAYVLANLRIAFPDIPQAERRAIGRESYVQFAWNMIDVARGATWGAAELIERVELAWRENLEQALAKGRGAMGLTLHLGSFEVAIRIVPALGFPLTVIGRPLTNRLLRRDMFAQRTSTGAELILHRNVAPQMLRALNRTDRRRVERPGHAPLARRHGAVLRCARLDLSRPRADRAARGRADRARRLHPHRARPTPAGDRPPARAPRHGRPARGRRAAHRPGQRRARGLHPRAPRAVDVEPSALPPQPRPARRSVRRSLTTPAACALPVRVR
jgi:hypothetical protein